MLAGLHQDKAPLQIVLEAGQNFARLHNLDPLHSSEAHHTVPEVVQNFVAGHIDPEVVQNPEALHIAPEVAQSSVAGHIDPEVAHSFAPHIVLAHHIHLHQKHRLECGRKVHQIHVQTCHRA